MDKKLMPTPIALPHKYEAVQGDLLGGFFLRQHTVFSVVFGFTEHYSV
jgi:hypothetical protein